jgi:hypothetical protein
MTGGGRFTNEVERNEMFSGRAWRVVKFGDPEAAVELQEMT